MAQVIAADGSSIGQRIKLIRQKVGLSQDEFAKKLGYSKRALINWEKGIADPSVSLLQTLLQEYSVDLEWLVTGASLSAQDGVHRTLTIVSKWTKFHSCDWPGFWSLRYLIDSSILKKRQCDWSSGSYLAALPIWKGGVKQSNQTREDLIIRLQRWLQKYVG